MENLSFSVGTIINVGTFILAGSALYWRLKIEMTKLELEIAGIKDSRKEDWQKHDEEQEKHEAISSAILSGIGEIKGDMKQVKTDISWLKQK